MSLFKALTNVIKTINTDTTKINEKIENNITTKAECEGLYPHEILVLHYAPSYNNKHNEYQKFWQYKYNLSEYDIDNILDKLFNKNLITLSNIKETINTYKTSNIKEVLKKFELKTNGNKDELINRLLDNVDENNLSNIFDEVPYVRTKDGDTLLKKYEWVSYVHNNSKYLDELTINNFTEKTKDIPFGHRDKIWGYFNNLSLQYASNGEWGLYRNINFAKAQFVAEEGKIEDALKYLCRVSYMDLSGLDNNCINVKKWISVHHEMGMIPMVMLSTGIIGQIREYANTLGLTNDELHIFMLKNIVKNEIPFSIFSVEECADIIVSNINSNADTLIEEEMRLNSIIEERF